MYDLINQRCQTLEANFREISIERKEILEKISDYIRIYRKEGKAIQLLYVCTHNSRRSHLGQVWAAVAAKYYQVDDVKTYSGGTEETSFHPNAIKALVNAGFQIKSSGEDPKPEFKVFFGDEDYTVCFSKRYDHPTNPRQNFVAIMTCSDAADNCPNISGCELRVGTTYHDPKAFDNTVLQDEKYAERSNQIAMECLYVFSKI